MKVLAWVIVALSLATPVLGRATEQASAAGTPRPPALEREARQIETMLIAPCCWSEQVSRHHSEVAEQVKEEIRAMLAAGLTRQQVLDRFGGAYGVRILVEPPDAGFSRVLHDAPWVLALGSLVGLAFVIRHLTGRQVRGAEAGEAPRIGPSDPLASQAASADAEETYRQRLDDELRDLD